MSLLPQNDVLQVLNLDRVPFPEFAAPADVGHFSSDKDGNVHLDKSRLSTCLLPDDVGSLRLDLNDGFDRLIEQNSRSPGCLDKFLRWIIEEHRRRRRRNSSSDEFRSSAVSLNDVIFGVDLVCWRGLFTKLAASPYERQENWLIGAVRFRGVLFLMEFETEEKKAKNLRMTERDKRMTFWGHRFERYVVGARGTQPWRCDDVVVDCNEQYCAIFRTKLGLSNDSAESRRFRILYGAEIDCLDDRGKYVELKTSRVIDGLRQEQNFKRFKLLKWWLQAYLAGIDRVICGHRDDAGIVKYLKTYEVSEMPRAAADGGNSFAWKPANCLAFLYELLLFMDRHVASDRVDCLSDMVVFEFHPQSRQVRVVRNHRFSSNQILPDWFTAVFGKT